jgi:hypothetical protein
MRLPPLRSCQINPAHPLLAARFAPDTPSPEPRPKNWAGLILRAQPHVEASMVEIGSLLADWFQTDRRESPSARWRMAGGRKGPAGL